MKRLFWMMAYPIMFVALVAFVLFFMTSAHSGQVREEGQRVIFDARVRMEKVASTGNMNDLLSACNAGSGEVSCRQTDYDITYRGHRILASNIAIDYQRVMHDRWDSATQRYMPFMTANVHLERQPRLEYYGWVVN